MAHPRDPTRDLLREISSRDVRGDLRGISGILINFIILEPMILMMPIKTSIYRPIERNL